MSRPGWPSRLPEICCAARRCKAALRSARLQSARCCPARQQVSSADRRSVPHPRLGSLTRRCAACRSRPARLVRLSVSASIAASSGTAGSGRHARCVATSSHWQGGRSTVTPSNGKPVICSSVSLLRPRCNGESCCQTGNGSINTSRRAPAAQAASAIRSIDSRVTIAKGASRPWKDRASGACGSRVCAMQTLSSGGSIVSGASIIARTPKDIVASPSASATTSS